MRTRGDPWGPAPLGNPHFLKKYKLARHLLIDRNMYIYVYIHTHTCYDRKLRPSRFGNDHDYGSEVRKSRFLAYISPLKTHFLMGKTGKNTFFSRPVRTRGDPWRPVETRGDPRRLEIRIFNITYAYIRR